MRGHEVEMEVIVEGENTQMSKTANRPGGGSDRLATARSHLGAITSKFASLSRRRCHTVLTRVTPRIQEALQVNLQRSTVPAERKWCFSSVKWITTINMKTMANTATNTQLSIISNITCQELFSGSRL